MGDAPESRHLRRAEMLLDKVSEGLPHRVKHPWDRGPNHAKLDSLQVENLGWTPKEEWER